MSCLDTIKCFWEAVSSNSSRFTLSPTLLWISECVILLDYHYYTCQNYFNHTFNLTIHSHVIPLESFKAISSVVLLGNGRYGNSLGLISWPVWEDMNFTINYVYNYTVNHFIHMHLKYAVDTNSQNCIFGIHHLGNTESSCFFNSWI